MRSTKPRSGFTLALVTLSVPLLRTCLLLPSVSLFLWRIPLVRARSLLARERDKLSLSLSQSHSLSPSPSLSISLPTSAYYDLFVFHATSVKIHVYSLPFISFYPLSTPTVPVKHHLRVVKQSLFVPLLSPSPSSLSLFLSLHLTIST